jgi:uncharacterized protein (DUF2249 family)
MPTLTSSDPRCIDVRTVSPPARHPLIFGTFDGLAAGESFEILNDHDPLPLYFQFERSRTGEFEWRYLQTGPSVWQVRIGRVGSGMQPAAAARVSRGPDEPGCGGGGGGCQCQSS